jgi:cytochrome c oxidase subunit 1
MPRRYASYPAEFETLHAWSTYGSWILGVGLILMTINLLVAVVRGKKAPDNPYNSLSLEWQMASPPPHENFDKIPTVTDWTYGYGKNTKAEA